MDKDKLINELCKLYRSPTGVRFLLEDAGFKPGDIIYVAELTPYQHWRYILQDIDNGRVENGYERLRAAILKGFPYNTTIKEIFTGISLTAKNRAAEEKTLPFDVFLSYNSKDFDKVNDIAMALEMQDINPWFDESELIGGTYILSAIEQVLTESNTVIVFIGRNGIGRWQDLEIVTAIDFFTKRKTGIIPVLLDGMAPETLPPFLRQFKALPYSTATHDFVISQLKNSIKKRP